jgi:predicted kinase
MATLHLVCGLPCAGKTTLARQLEQEYAALRLTPDEWHTRLFGQDAEEDAHNARHDRIEALLWGIAARVLTLGTDVILDFGFWSRVEREDYRSRAAQLGAGSEIHFLDVPGEVLLERLAARNAQLPQGAFDVPEALMRSAINIFEPPAADELVRREPANSVLLDR